MLTSISAFSAEDSSGDRELWHTDGTEADTVLVANINPVDSSNPEGFRGVGGKILFRATTPDSGQELWTFGDVDCGDAPDPALPTLLQNAG